MGSLAQLCEDIRNAVDDEGAGHCFSDAVSDYHEKTGLPIQGLWAVVDAVIDNGKPEKVIRRIHKSWGGDVRDWIRWFAIAKSKPNC